MLIHWPYNLIEIETIKKSVDLAETRARGKKPSDLSLCASAERTRANPLASKISIYFSRRRQRVCLCAHCD